MDKKVTLYDIGEVCDRLGVSSRALRFYEDKGLIKSTRIGISSRRKYTEAQLALVKNVLVLRTLGLSIKAIVELQNREIDLKHAIVSRRAEIYARIDSHMREISLLNEAISTLEDEKSIFYEKEKMPQANDITRLAILKECVGAIIGNDSDTLYRHLSHRMARYMPTEAFSSVRSDALLPLGNFLLIDGIETDDNFPQKMYAYLRFEKLGLKLTFVFCGEKIDGLWLGYYETKGEKNQ